MTSAALGLVPEDFSGPLQQQKLLIEKMLTGVRTVMPVKVIDCTNSGGVSPVGTLTALPLVSQVHADGSVEPMPNLYELPYLRLAGGSNGIIIDPQPGDIGLAAFCDRDISAVKESQGAAPPGSLRKHDMSDAVYLSTIIGQAPTQYVQFSPGGIEIHSPSEVKVTAQAATVQAQTVTVTATTSATVTSPSISLGATGQTLASFITAAFQSLFNSHTHPIGGLNTDAPNQLLGSSHMTTVVKGG